MSEILILFVRMNANGFANLWNSLETLYYDLFLHDRSSALIEHDMKWDAKQSIFGNILQKKMNKREQVIEIKENCVVGL